MCVLLHLVDPQSFLLAHVHGAGAPSLGKWESNPPSVTLGGLGDMGWCWVQICISHHHLAWLLAKVNFDGWVALRLFSGVLISPSAPGRLGWGLR